ncbi:hypothetical protein QJQ45_023034 [Haematococcus lacustris]|nr:hypothetical protein QJQ45_023034 [Haematococcus lacustris]
MKVASLISCLCLLLLHRAVHGDRGFIGWSEKLDTGAEDSGTGMVGWAVTVVHGSLHADECDSLISSATPRLARSGVSDANTGEGKLSDIRTSSVPDCCRPSRLLLLLKLLLLLLLQYVAAARAPAAAIAAAVMGSLLLGLLLLLLFRSGWLAG